MIVRVGAMPFQNHYVITENIERFEGLLREGELDSMQTRTVEFLLDIESYSKIQGQPLFASEIQRLIEERQ